MREKLVCYELIGVQTPGQLKENLAVLERLDLSPDEIEAIDFVTTGGQIDTKLVW